ncbi:unnamed protein product [Leptidea sinapis]|uniref:Cathepsin propeptide inhibitor domain-containing protein n=1 Tax=Leptidea sinapis TaxID=189913 RepID=A0A5E4Q6S2_9NEOP|nr:unnamed protein product [Leptidea sinapis]
MLRGTICAMLALVAAACSRENIPHYDIREAPILFEKFKKDYNRHYASEYDEKIHYEAFVKQLKKIIQDNSRGRYIADINKFADYTDEEFNHMNGLILPRGRRSV